MIRGLRGSLRHLPYHAARTHLGTMGELVTPSPPLCRLDLAPSLADRFAIRVAPFHYGLVLLLKPFRLHLTVDALPSDASASAPETLLPGLDMSPPVRDSVGL